MLSEREVRIGSEGARVERLSCSGSDSSPWVRPAGRDTSSKGHCVSRRLEARPGSHPPRQTQRATRGWRSLRGTWKLP